MLQVTGCSSLQQQNFHKQKYLRGKLNPVYDDNQKTKTAHPEDAVNDVPLRNETDQSVSSSENRTGSFDEITSAEKPAEEDEPLSEPVRQIKKEKKQQPLHSKAEKKSGFNKSVSPKKMSASSDIGTRLTWFIILIALGLIALPFALLIGFWAFIISGVLILTAGIILVSADCCSGFFETLFMMIVVIGLIGILCVAAVIALIWFIIWGIIQLVN